MRVVGVEPTRLAAQEPKSCASANSTIPAYSSILQLRPNRLNIVSVPAEKVNHCIDISALHSAYYRRTIVSFSMAERGFLPMRRSKLRRAGSIAATYLLVAALAVLGWLWHSLPAEILLEPGQTLTLPRFAYVQPLRTAGSRNAASTQAAGSYQATLSIGGWLPVKTVRALVETRPVVTVCGTPFGVKMFSEGALIVGFSDLNTPDGTANPAKKAGLRLGDRVVRMDDTLTETNDAVHDALETAAGAPVQVVYIRNGEQFQTRLTPVWDSTAGQWRAVKLFPAGTLHLPVRAFPVKKGSGKIRRFFRNLIINIISSDDGQSEAEAILIVKAAVEAPLLSRFTVKAAHLRLR